MSIFDGVRSIIINGKIVNSIVTANNGVIYQNQWSTSLTIDIPLNITYSDAFNISGTLTDRRSNLLIGKTVKLLVGSTVVDTTETNSNGEYAFTHTPVSTGNHSFQVKFDGDTQYDASESAIVTREVGKETTILTNESTYNGNTLNIRVVLTDDDGIPIAGKDINVKKKTTGSSEQVWIIQTTHNDGAIYSIHTDGGVDYVRAIFNGDDNYAPCGLIIPYDPPVPTVLTVTGDKDIISYADSESCTVTAKVLNQNGNVMSGVSLGYSVEHDGSVLDSGTGVTDGDGEVSVQYSATGIGDVEFTFKYGSSLQETYEIIDLFMWSSLDTYTEDTILNIPNMPVNFKAIFNIKVDSILQLLISGFNISFGNSNNQLVFGIHEQKFGIFYYDGNTYTELIYEESARIASLIVQSSRSIIVSYLNGELNIQIESLNLSAEYILEDRDIVKIHLPSNQGSITNLTINQIV